MSIKLHAKMKPVGVIKARLGVNPSGKVQRQLVHTCAIHMDKYVPKRDGDLATSVEEGINYIRYNTPYAHYQYEGILYVDPETGSPWARKDATKVPTNRRLTYHTPGTGHHWDRRMVSAEMDEVEKEVEDFMRRKK